MTRSAVDAEQARCDESGQAGTGASSRRSLSAFSSSHRSGAIDSRWSDAFRWICSADRAPTQTLTTAGCASGKAIAAAGNVVPWRSADRGDRACPSDDLGRRLTVVVATVVGRASAGEQAAVEDTGGDDCHAPCLAERKQVVEAVLLEQRVPAGQHQDVDVRVPHELGEHRGLVHPGTDGGHGAFFA